MTFIFGRAKSVESSTSGESAMVKLFFDSFSQRVHAVEDEVKSVERAVEDLRSSRDRSQTSDLVLLERLQRVEGMLAESLGWLKRLANAINVVPEKAMKISEEGGADSPSKSVQEAHGTKFLQRFVMPGGEAGSLASITTPTELQVLALLAEQGPKSAPEIGQVIGRSREHSARLMKKLFEEGYVRRDQTRIPFRYSLVERVRASFKGPEKREESAEGEAQPVQAG